MKSGSFFKNHSQAIGIGLLLLAILFFVRLKMQNTDSNGIITIAKVIRYEGAESGSDLYIEIQLEGKKYLTSVDQECQHDCVGKYFFVKVLRDNPISYVIFYGSKEVPDCIISNERYFKGWSYIPTCSNYQKSFSK